MTAFLDTAIFMYAGGGDHTLRVPCQTILQRAKNRQLIAVTSAEVIQEIIHRYMAIERHETGVAIAREALAIFSPVLAVTDRKAHRLVELVGRYPTLEARDLVHVATCIEEGIEVIISPDRGFDVVTEVRRLDPVEAAG